jgi:hypothetical protein
VAGCCEHSNEASGDIMRPGISGLDEHRLLLASVPRSWLVRTVLW